MAQPLRKYTKAQIKDCLEELRALQAIFQEKYGVNDIFSNSKIYEVIIANELGHELIPGHSGSKDARDKKGGEYEYKHYKAKSSNHTWTFNDYSSTTIASLATVKQVIFGYINDINFPPFLEWYIPVDGKVCSEYLKRYTEDLVERQPRGKVNDRRMVNISPRQLIQNLGAQKVEVEAFSPNGPYGPLLNRVYQVAHELEDITGVDNILTSSKLWEVLLSVEFDHSVNSEQGGRVGGYDASDSNGKTYEYKISKTYSWQFQDISEAVLTKYLDDEAVILAVVDKSAIKVMFAFSVKPTFLVPMLRQKLVEKEGRYALLEKEVRRKQISLTRSDILSIGAIQLI